MYVAIHIEHINSHIHIMPESKNVVWLQTNNVHVKKKFEIFIISSVGDIILCSPFYIILHQEYEYIIH